MPREPCAGSRILMQALVTDAHLRTAVAAIRGFGRAGIRPIATGPAGAAGLASRFASKRVTTPDATADRAGFTAALVTLASRHGPFVLYPCQEASLDASLELAVGDNDAIRLPLAVGAPTARLRDKRELSGLAARAGLAALEDYYSGPASGVGDVPFPSVLKPLEADGALQRIVALHSRADLDNATRRLPADEPVLIQELATGDLSAVVLLVAPDGRLVARFQQRALRTWPNGAGPSAVAVSVVPDDELIDRAHALLRSAGYWGLAEMQLVGTRRGPALIDVNTRFYGSLPLALRAGVNFPALWHALATDGDLPDRSPGYLTDVGFRWLEADLSALMRGNVGALAGAGPRPRVGAMWASDDRRASLRLARAAIGVRVRRRVGGERA
ncbi:MAG: hypothetical protein QOJ29_2221 [Thermoleophilaceae bacterium]|nr:hypothetical protein [Thermoleophilaceae bacterium]